MADTLEFSRDKRKRAFIAGRFELELDGVDCGILHSIDGGHFKSEAIGEKVGGDGLVTRYPGRQKFEEITITCGAEMASPLWAWVNESIGNNPSRRTGEIVCLDFDGYERNRRRFEDALISEIQFPALDAKSKEAKRFTIKIAPERFHYTDEIRRPAKRQVNVDMKPQKRLLPINFSMKIDGIDPEITRQISKIEGFSVKQNIIDNPMGGLLYVRKEAGRVEFPNISLTISETFVRPFMAWWQEFVAKGNHVHANEKNGSISYLDSTLTQEICHISLQSMGITGITFDKHDGHAEGIRNVKVDMYCESLDFRFNGAR